MWEPRYILLGLTISMPFTFRFLEPRRLFLKRHEGDKSPDEHEVFETETGGWEFYDRCDPPLPETGINR